MKRSLLVGSLWFAVGTTGCMTVSGEQLTPLQGVTAAPEVPPTLEQSVGNFSFHLDGGKMITSNKAGRMINDEILKAWKKKGYIVKSEYVKSAQFTGQADYNFTLSGSLYGESSIFLQILSGLTLFVIPHTIEQKFDIQYTLEDVRTKQKYGASVEDSYTQWGQLFLIFAAPWSGNGARNTYEAMADHLYDQLRRDGAFDGSTAKAPSR
jgi:hypothetical protein